MYLRRIPLRRGALDPVRQFKLLFPIMIAYGPAEQAGKVARAGVFAERTDVRGITKRYAPETDEQCYAYPAEQDGER